MPLVTLALAAACALFPLFFTLGLCCLQGGFRGGRLCFGLLLCLLRNGLLSFRLGSLLHVFLGFALLLPGNLRHFLCDAAFTTILRNLNLEFDHLLLGTFRLAGGLPDCLLRSLDELSGCCHSLLLLSC